MNITGLSDQEVFDTVVNHLRIQGKCLNWNNRPSYVAGPKKDPIGLFLENEEYNPSVEGLTILDCINDKKFPNSFISRIDKYMDLLAELQAIHDIYEQSEWENEFKQLANNLNLNYKDMK